MDHWSFLKTMQQKRGLESLGPRQDAAQPFTEVFASSSRSLDSCPGHPTYPGGEVSLDFDMIRGIDLGTMPLKVLQVSILAAMREFHADELADTPLPITVKDALELLDRAKFLRFPKL
jgi:hypothetical protein